MSDFRGSETTLPLPTRLQQHPVASSDELCRTTSLDCASYGHSWQQSGLSRVKRCLVCGLIGYCPGCTPHAPTPEARPFFCTRHTTRASTLLADGEVRR